MFVSCLSRSLSRPLGGIIFLGRRGSGVLVENSIANKGSAPLLYCHQVVRETIQGHRFCTQGHRNFFSLNELTNGARNRRSLYTNHQLKQNYSDPRQTWLKFPVNRLRKLGTSALAIFAVSWGGYVLYLYFQNLGLFGATVHADGRNRNNFIADVVEKAGPAVVFLEIKGRHPLTGRPVTLSNGSGFIVRSNGLIITNAHVIANKSTVSVKLQDGRLLEGQVTAVDPISDLAAVKIPATNLPVIPLGSSADIRPGEWVIAMGSPLSLSNTVTCGIVSSVQRASRELGLRNKEMDYIQTDAVINELLALTIPCDLTAILNGGLLKKQNLLLYSSPGNIPLASSFDIFRTNNASFVCQRLTNWIKGFGNSGGPLVNMDGKAIGINTMKVTTGISFAIPADYAVKFLTKTENLMKTGRTENGFLKRRYMGITMLTLTATVMQDLKNNIKMPSFPDVNGGVFVYKVIPGTPAYIGGILAGDIIIDISGTPIKSAADVYDLVEKLEILRVTVIRGNKKEVITINTKETI